MCFGIQAVFGFMSMDYLSADAYALYSQTSIVILTLAWTIFFRTKLSGNVWISVIVIAVGMAGFKMGDTKTLPTGLVFIGLKIMTQSFACLWAEAFIKSDPEPLYIQLAWMKPVELLATCLLMFTPGIPQFQDARNAIMTQGFFHHWNWLVVFIMCFNMGDTYMTATIAKQFDSVVKGVAGVADIIYPTQVVSLFINGWPEYDLLQWFSGCTIVLGALNFVFAKGAMGQTAKKNEEIQTLKAKIRDIGGSGSV
jgi:hypothetical protein